MLVPRSSLNYCSHIVFMRKKKSLLYSLMRKSSYYWKSAALPVYRVKRIKILHIPISIYTFELVAFFLTVKRPTIRPKRPKTEPKISTTKTLTKSWGSWASAKAALEPVMPTQTPQRRLHTPTVRPPQKMACPVDKASVPHDLNITNTQMLTCKVVRSRVELFRWHVVKLCWIDDGHDDTIDGNDFAKDNRNEIARLDARCLDSTTQKRRACNVDTPIAIK